MWHSDEFWHLTDWVGHVQPVAALGRSLGKCESPSWRSHIQAVETMGLELLTQCCGLWFFAVVCLFAALLTVNCWTLLCSFVGHLVSVQRGSLSFTLTWSCCGAPWQSWPRNFVGWAALPFEHLWAGHPSLPRTHVSCLCLCSSTASAMPWFHWFQL